MYMHIRSQNVEKKRIMCNKSKSVWLAERPVTEWNIVHLKVDAKAWTWNMKCILDTFGYFLQSFSLSRQVGEFSRNFTSEIVVKIWKFAMKYHWQFSPPPQGTYQVSVAHGVATPVSKWAIKYSESLSFNFCHRQYTVLCTYSIYIRFNQSTCAVLHIDNYCYCWHKKL